MSDLIDRQSAIDALNEYFDRIGKLKRRGLNKGEKAIRLDTVGTINSLPPAEPKIIKCDYVKACNKVTMNKTFSAWRYLAMLDDFEEYGYVLVDMREVTT